MSNMDILADFGQRIKALRSRSGMSQQTLAERCQLDRTYIGGIERGERNVSLINIERIAHALNVSVSYIFSEERLTPTTAYQQKDFIVPFSKRFKYCLDPGNKVLAFQVNGLLTGESVDYMSKTLRDVCSAFKQGELNIIVDHREMKTANGEAAVYSPDVADRAVLFQQMLMDYSKKAIVLCNSDFMVHQLHHVTKISGIYDKTVPLYAKDRAMVDQAYSIAGVNGNELITYTK